MYLLFISRFPIKSINLSFCFSCDFFLLRFNYECTTDTFHFTDVAVGEYRIVKNKKHREKNIDKVFGTSFEFLMEF